MTDNIELVRAYRAGKTLTAAQARRARYLIEQEAAEARPGPGAVCWEFQAGELPIRLSFSVKVF